MGGLIMVYNANANANASSCSRRLRPVKDEGLLEAMA